MGDKKDQRGVHALDQPEQRDGWIILPLGKGWKAVRQGTLTAWQIAYGCQLMIFASSRGELEILLTAEKIKDDLIDIAARFVEGMREATERRAREIAEDVAAERGHTGPTGAAARRASGAGAGNT